MSKVVFIKSENRNSGTPVKIKGETKAYELKSVILDIDGFLYSFKVDDIEYRFFGHYDFNEKDQKDAEAAKIRPLHGYWNYNKFLEYKRENEESDMIQSEKINLYKFSYDKFEIASFGDYSDININVFSEPFEFWRIYVKNNYPIEFQNNYPKIYDSLEPFGKLDIVLQEENILTVELNQSDPQKNFFLINFKNHVQSWLTNEVSIAEIEKRCKYITLSCFRIFQIVEEIFSKLSDDTIEGLITVAEDHFINNDSLGFWDMTNDVDKLLATLLKDWGYLYAHNNPQGSLEASLLLPSTSSTEDYRLLYQSLFYFYDNTYYLNFEGYNIEQKMDFLFNLISADALAVLPYPYREQKIINLIITEKFNEDNLNYLIKLFDSIENNSNDCNKLLDKILSEFDNRTIFSILLTKLQDSSLEIDGNDIPLPYFGYKVEREYRLKVTNILFKIWVNSSKYNTSFDDGQIENLPQNNFFENDSETGGKKYLFDQDGYPITDLLFDFNIIEDPTNSDLHTGQFSYSCRKEFSEKGKEITIYKELMNIGEVSTWNRTSSSNYHMYQPIILVGANKEIDIDIKLPENALVPAFVFYLYERYDLMKNYEAFSNFTFEVTLEVVFAICTGGGSAIPSISRHLRHLRLLKLANVGKVIKNPSAYPNLIINLTKGIISTSAEAILIPSAWVYSLSEVMHETSDDPETQEFWDDTRQFALYLMISSGVVIATPYVFKARKLATKIKQKATLFLALSADLKSLINKLADDVSGAIFNSFLDRVDAILSIDNIPDNITPWFNSLTDIDLKAAFVDDFVGLFNFNTEYKDFWIRLNKLDGNGNPFLLERWKKLKELNLPERLDINILENTTLINKYDGVFFTEDILAAAMKNLSVERRIEFLNTFENVDQTFIDRLIQKPQAIGRWADAPAQTRLLAKNDPEYWLYYGDDLPYGSTFKPVGGNSVKDEFIDLDGIVYFRGERFGPPPRFNIQGLIKFKKLSIAGQQAKIDQAITTFRQGNVKYSNPVTYQGIQIPISSYDGVLGMAPDFKGLGMAFDPPGSNTLGNGITNIPGLTEPLTSIIQKIKSFPDGVKVPIVENTRNIDYKNMWIKMGINPNDGKIIKKELELEIHHLDDLDIDLQTTLQLVTDKAHNVTKSHSGSVKLNEIFFDLINNL